MRLPNLKDLKASTFWQSMNTLPATDKPKFLIVSLLQVGLGFLDLLGIAIIGVLGALTVTGISSKQPGNRVAYFLSIIGIEDLKFQNQVAILGAIATVILMARTILSIMILKRVFLFLSNRSASMTSNLVSKLLSQSLIEVQKRSTQETVFALTHGVSSITLGVLGSAVNLVSDGSLLLIIAIGLFLVDPVIAFSSLILFGALAMALYWSMNVKAQLLGNKSAELSILSSKKIIEVLESYRESVVRNRRSYYAKQISDTRYQFASTQAELHFMPNMSKYIIESGVVIGAVAISGIQFLLQDAAHAVATLSVFLAAGTRIAPAIMRLQQSAISMKANAGSALSTISLIKELSEITSPEISNAPLDTIHQGFIGSVEIKDICLQYPGKENLALKMINLKIEVGESVAIVGPSGAGKTSLVDVLLGVITPSKGEINISDSSPSACISKWPGAIAYVPQDVKISDTTIGGNISLGYENLASNNQLILDAVKVSQLSELIDSLPDGIETLVGERGTNLSGGQRQRLGIARALFTRPKLLVLDEATSSLDGQTEADISSAIDALRGSVTIILIAHRLSSVRHVDKVVYMDSGEIKAIGSFEEVRAKVPDFDRQAQLMGL
jgi:ABC-type multidrug transport system fused ATPase/permease subunit